ncbi:hypothetical protein AK812_SmicGene15904 [Symbiodinium microadriaticum]|uniref:Uncharacterized protein n=1 Tax=Symbiodinium microadriaticum TaxID=2951 RepID=A0A1Q9E1P4_SYMMI|nr:hypothetical protein AK812_SmicGene15904 [Symbiodinium microadriaticum]
MSGQTVGSPTNIGSQSPAKAASKKLPWDPINEEQSSSPCSTVSALPWDPIGQEPNAAAGLGCSKVEVQTFNDRSFMRKSLDKTFDLFIRGLVQEYRGCGVQLVDDDGKIKTPAGKLLSYDEVCQMIPGFFLSRNLSNGVKEVRRFFSQDSGTSAAVVDPHVVLLAARGLDKKAPATADYVKRASFYSLPSTTISETETDALCDDEADDVFEAWARCRTEGDSPNDTIMHKGVHYEMTIRNTFISFGVSDTAKRMLIRSHSEPSLDRDD